MKLRGKIFIWFIALVYLMGEMGCATGRYEYSPAEPLSEAYRSQLGTIGVVRSSFVPDIQIDRPPPPPSPPPSAGVLERTGRGAWEGAKESVVLWTDGILSNLPQGGGGPVGILLLLGLITLAVPVALAGGLGGAIVGALALVEPPAYLEETETFLRDTLAKYPIQERFQNHFLEEARARTSHTFVMVPEQEPQTLEPLDEMFDDVQTYNEESQTSEEMDGQGVDTVLELYVRRIWLKQVGAREMNPPMVWALFVRARLVRGTGKTLWYDQTFVHETDSHPYQVWPHYNRVQNAIEQAYQNLAKQVVNKLFFNTSS